MADLTDAQLNALQNLARKKAGEEAPFINISAARALTELGLAERSREGWDITPEGSALPGPNGRPAQLSAHGTGLETFLRALSRNRTVGSLNAGDTRWHLPQLSRVPARTAWSISSAIPGAPSGRRTPRRAARFQTFREATRAALRLPSALRAYALPAES